MFSQHIQKPFTSRHPNSGASVNSKLSDTRNDVKYRSWQWILQITKQNKWKKITHGLHNFKTTPGASKQPYWYFEKRSLKVKPLPLSLKFLVFHSLFKVSLIPEWRQKRPDKFFLFSKCGGAKFHRDSLYLRKETYSEIIQGTAVSW
jgi:hypothetical protein